MDELMAAVEKICKDKPEKYTLSIARSGDKNMENPAKINKAAIRSLGQGWQLERKSKTQVFHENFDANELCNMLYGLLGEEFLALNAAGENFDWNLKISKKGKVLLSKAKANAGEKSCGQHGGPAPHNRQKNYIIQEGTVVPPLVEMGLMTAQGKIISSMMPKFRQINRFIEIINDVVKHENKKEFSIIDFGCGKSYLSFILYYYFSDIMGFKVNMLGLDLRQDVVEKSRQAAAKHGYRGLRFEVGDIKGYNSDFKPDMVISLHACDTATDYAIANAVKWGAEYIFSVPCCQHQLSGQMKSDRFSILESYGIIKERAAALFTDAIRANLLCACGYTSNILEFTDFDDTPKNLLIRAKKANIAKEQRRKKLEEVHCLREEFSLSPLLLKLLEDELKGL